MGILNKICYVLASFGFFILATGIQSPPKPNHASYQAEEEGDAFTPSSPISNQAAPEEDELNPNPTADPNNPNPQDPGPGGNGTFSSNDAMSHANKDNAPIGYCARGVANIAEAQGLGNFRGLHAHDFPNKMAAQGYVLSTQYNQYNAPEGAILTYNSDVRMGNPPRNPGGGKYGHVEFVSYTPNGQRKYTSSHVSSNPGGSVNNNFSGVWVKAN